MSPPAEPDPAFSNPRLAAIYDVVDGDRSDLTHYLAMLDEFGVGSLLDIVRTVERGRNGTLPPLGNAW